ncbi:MAG: endonuclease Q family protein [Candidatus Bathyarchaeota archaeon]|nr:endonuclease Q family protein [Candidatus Bathyarchaeota archaeon]
MRVIADLHIHSRFSRATSQKMNIDEVTRFAQIKGLNLLGTGDFTHPKWLEELKRDLVEFQETSLYKLAKDQASPVLYMITGEVCTIFTFENSVKKIHHVILTPSIETAVQINERLARYGNLAIDGRPMLDMTAPQLVEEIMQISSENVVIPAHAWTPWFSLFGAFSGFNRIEDCYQDMTKHIPALETGLSSDPPMNWRLSMLDKYSLVSNSDSHSPWPWRIGREANVFDLEPLTYFEVVDAIRQKDSKRFRFTIETNPAYGKYHWTGHRNCKVALSPQEAIKFGNRCPVCRKRLTKGVEQRVEELADRPVGFKPAGAIGYVHLLPLSEIIVTVLGVSYPSVQKVWDVYNTLTAKFGSEYAVLIDASQEEMSKIVNPQIAEAVTRVREGKVDVVPGYDGVYGQLLIFPEQKETVPKREKIEQRSLADFM